MAFQKAAETALAETQARFPGASMHNDSADAFRHAFWNSLMTKEMGPVLAEAFATAHETFPGNPAREMAMDLHNNAVGRQIGQRQIIATLPNGMKMNIEVQNGHLSRWTMEALNNGQLQISA